MVFVQFWPLKFFKCNCNGEKAIGQQMEINQGFTTCNHNKFV